MVVVFHNNPTPTTEVTTGQITTAEPTYDPWWWFVSTTTPTTTTTGQITTAEPTYDPWWWFFPTTTPTPTTEVTTGQITTAEPTDDPWWWFFSTTTPTTTTEVTTGQITTAEPTYDPWWWFFPTTTPTTTTTGQITTAEPTYDPWWWFFSTTTPTTEATTTPRHTSSRTHLYSTTPPLSKLPLQFSVLVDPPAPSCQEGLFLPKFVNPTPENGAHIQAEVNKEVEIRVKAQAAYATIRDIIISGPLNIQKHRTTHDEFVIRWTPTPDDLGAHYPICFAVESVTGADIYQSEMRCVLVDIVATQVVANVICSQSTMTVEVEKSSFSGLNEDHLRLSDPTNTVCSLRTHSNSTHIIAVIPLNACGTQIEEDDDNLIFKNEITAVDNTEDLITRKHLLEVQFYCQYPKRGNVTLGYTAHRKSITVWEKGFGTFTYQFEFFPDNQFQTMIDPNSYPLEYDVGSRIYMQIDATSSANNTELFVESCSAAPYDNPNYRPTYSIIENGCKVDSSVEIHSSTNKRQFQFSMEAFRFIGLHDQVYISCSVLMCEAGDPHTRCSKGCINSTSRVGHHHNHGKREAVTQSLRHFVSQGPLRLTRSAESTGSPVISLDLNLVFIAGCLLAAVAMICALAMFKAKMSRAKYQPLPTFVN
ncbi:CUB and zona pellucida-like domain-containing protein 1 isoform X1 [Micropterus salmoides]|uniref:CUB and zona pellucida-like domain-containing protein 1 isoform X1 n=1 Tax=Micropterus salmoides TaxID=27706 RepID=UPI0018EA358D|nr:CUB and zona pellucida-like domain-containing protein 1 isoform X1 [Micropterus salmoides]